MDFAKTPSQSSIHTHSHQQWETSCSAPVQMLAAPSLLQAKVVGISMLLNCKSLITCEVFFSYVKGCIPSLNCQVFQLEYLLLHIDL